MNPHVQDKLCQIVARYGASVVDDPRRCEGLLRDLCPHDKREVHVLVGALKERIPAELASLALQKRAAASVGRLARRLEDNLALAEEPARWAVESWALALGVATPQQMAAARPKKRQRDAAVKPPPVVASSANGAATHTVTSRGRGVAIAFSMLLILSGTGLGLAWNSSLVRDVRSHIGWPARAATPAVPTVAAESPQLEASIASEVASTPAIAELPDTRPTTAHLPGGERSKLTDEELRMVKEVDNGEHNPNEVRD
jgi:hypothetical protein